MEKEMETKDNGEFFLINDDGKCPSCNYGAEDVPCEPGPPGKLKCRRVQVFPNYEGDIILQERAPRQSRSTRNQSRFKFLRNQVYINKAENIFNQILQFSLLWQSIAEFVGTMMIVLIGCGTVASAVLTGAQNGIWQVAVVWTIGVSLAIYSTASISGAHLNPAVSFAFAVFRRKEFQWYKLIFYSIAQYLGAMVGGAIVLAVFSPQINHLLEINDTTKGSGSGISIATASMFGEYFPNPGFAGVIEVSTLQALSIEALGTGILMFTILALTDNRSKAVRNKDFAPLLIGLTVGMLISIFAPFTQAGWNPARDFGPRLIACFAGWWGDAIPGPKNGFWIYILGPYIGSFIGTLFYDLTVSLGLASARPETE